MSDNKKPSRLEALKSQMDEKDVHITNLEAKVTDLEAINAELSQEVAALSKSSEGVPRQKEASPLPTKSFKVEGEDYLFVIPQFRDPRDHNKIIKASEAITDKDLCEYLAKNKISVVALKSDVKK